MQQEGVILLRDFSLFRCAAGGTQEGRRNNFVVKIKTAISESSKNQKDLKAQ